MSGFMALNLDFLRALAAVRTPLLNGIMAAASSQGGSYNINLVVDGKTLAGVVYDPLNKIIKQKGEAAYA